MKPLIIIIALYLEPVGSITEQPWDFVEELEFIDPKSLEEIERELQRKKYRILEVQK